MHCRPCEDSKSQLTFESYLPAIVEPPGLGTRSSRPRVCHRLDFRVGGPVAVATTDEAMRSIKDSFSSRLVRKEYRAIVSGFLGEAGSRLVVEEPLDGDEACTHVEVAR